MTTEQLTLPQAYPLGQHPGSGPASFPHIYHPLAHVPVAEVVVGTAVMGTAMVWPLVLMMVLSSIGGQWVTLQSRPVWQQPPPAEARQG